MDLTEELINPSRTEEDARMASLASQAKSGFRVSGLGRAFVSFVVVEALILASIRIYQLSTSGEVDRDVIWWSGILGINLFFFVLLCASSVYRENKFELFAFLAASCLLSARVILEYLWHDPVCHHHSALCLGNMIGVLVAQAVHLLLAWYIYEDFGWRFYKTVGADVELKNMWTVYQGFRSLCKLDFYMVLLLLFTALYYSGDQDFYAGIAVASAMVVLEGIWELVGVRAVKRERRRSFLFFFVWGCITPNIMIVYLVKFYQSPSSTAGEAIDPLSAGSVFVKLLTLGALCVFVRLFVLAFGWKCYRHFGRGMRSRLFERQIMQATKQASKAAKANSALNHSLSGDQSHPSFLDEYVVEEVNPVEVVISPGRDLASHLQQGAMGSA